MIKHIVRIQKGADRLLNERSTRKQLDAIVAGINTAARAARGWSIEYSKSAGIPWKREDTDTDYETGRPIGPYEYHCDLVMACAVKRPDHDSDFRNILLALSSKGIATKWSISVVDNKPYSPPKGDFGGENGEVSYIPLAIPRDWPKYFQSLYGLDNHIAIVKAAIDAAIKSSFRHRFHVALIGPPGCGKSHICECIKAALGDESVLEFDGTSTTMAGAQKLLTEREELPRILLVEEIEKAESTLSWLLSVLDLRGEVRKTTARGELLRDTRLLCVATVNDLPTFDKVAFGALSSRFSNKLFFRRPSWAQLEQILEREIATVNGSDRWIAPTIELAKTQNPPISDPRQIIAIALCGRDDLLSGKYQRQLKATSKVED